MVANEPSDPNGTGTCGAVCRGLKRYLITGSSSTRRSDQALASVWSVEIEVAPLPIHAEEPAGETMIAYLAGEPHLTSHGGRGLELSLSWGYGSPTGGEAGSTLDSGYLGLDREG